MPRTGAFGFRSDYMRKKQKAPARTLFFGRRTQKMSSVTREFWDTLSEKPKKFYLYFDILIDSGKSSTTITKAIVML